MTRILSREKDVEQEELLLGEISGRWYFDHASQRFKQNRRHGREERRRPMRPPVYGLGLDSILPLPTELSDYQLYPITDIDVEVIGDL